MSPRYERNILRPNILFLSFHRFDLGVGLSCSTCLLCVSPAYPSRFMLTRAFSTDELFSVCRELM